MKNSIQNIKPHVSNFRSLARALTIVENDLDGANDLLKGLVFNKHAPVIGVTGPPGAGKSTLVNALIDQMTARGFKIAILAIDPTSPFNFGSLLGDRIRMAPYFNHPDVFIRSLATRGSMGGLSAKTIEMTDVLRSAGFDYVIIETVGVGQSEIEIAGLADLTLLVLVPESGDEIQNIKSGIMEIADAFIINKADRADAGLFANNLQKIISQKGESKVPVFKTVASRGEGLNDVVDFILTPPATKNSRKELLLAEKAYRIIQQKRMESVDRNELMQAILLSASDPTFNLYSFVEGYF
ncbi:MAG: methylmalonyl Co-A mutase-associated GTPase MeaB [Mucilaginibacter sp.]